jgi:hypothetical protein
MSLIPSLEAGVLEVFFKAGSVGRICNASADVYVALCSASAGESGTSANEVTTRVIVDTWTTPFVESGVVVCKSNEEASWTPGAVTASHFLLSNVNTTTHRFHDALAATVNVGASDTVRIRPGKLVVSIDGLLSREGGNGSPAYEILDYMLRNATTVSDNAGGYFGLSTTAPAPDGSNVTEPSVGAYARTSSIGFSTPLFTAATSGSSPTTLTSQAPVIWPEATASWGTPTHWVCYDASTSGNLLYYGEIDNPAEVTNGLQPRLDTGDLVLSCD